LAGAFILAMTCQTLLQQGTVLTKRGLTLETAVQFNGSATQASDAPERGPGAGNVSVSEMNPIVAVPRLLAGAATRSTIGKKLIHIGSGKSAYRQLTSGLPIIQDLQRQLLLLHVE
jgi:hypothetical protein